MQLSSLQSVQTDTFESARPMLATVTREFKEPAGAAASCNDLAEPSDEYLLLNLSVAAERLVWYDMGLTLALVWWRRRESLSKPNCDPSTLLNKED